MRCAGCRRSCSGPGATAGRWEPVPPSGSPCGGTAPRGSGRLTTVTPWGLPATTAAAQGSPSGPAASGRDPSPGSQAGSPGAVGTPLKPVSPCAVPHGSAAGESGAGGEGRRAGAGTTRSCRLTCRVGLLPLRVGELLALVLGPDPLLPQEAGGRGESGLSLGPAGWGGAPGRTAGQSGPGHLATVAQKAESHLLLSSTTKPPPPPLGLTAPMATPAGGAPGVSGGLPRGWGACGRPPRTTCCSPAMLALASGCHHQTPLSTRPRPTDQLCALGFRTPRLEVRGASTSRRGDPGRVAASQRPLHVAPKG